MAELKDKLINGHEAEFTYDECEYSIEMWDDEEIQYIGIWKCNENPICIAKMAVKNINDFDELFSRNTLAKQGIPGQIKEK